MMTAHPCSVLLEHGAAHGLQRNSPLCTGRTAKAQALSNIEATLKMRTFSVLSRSSGSLAESLLN